MDKAIVLGVVRHLLTSVGGAIASKGYVSGDEIDLLVGAIVTISGVAWSAYEKHARKTE